LGIKTSQEKLLFIVYSEMHTKHTNTETAAVPCIGWVNVVHVGEVAGI
jgi:hypothetical protein